MSEKRFVLYEHKENYYILKNPRIHLDFIEMLGDALTSEEIVEELNQLDEKVVELAEENEQLRVELETHKHPLWSTREAERKVNKLADSLADEVKKNGLLNEEINRLRIENMRLKKKGGDLE